VTRLRPRETRKRGLILGKDKRYFLSPIGADWPWGPIRLPDNWVPQAVCAEVKRPRREAGRLPSSAEVKTVIHPVPSWPAQGNRKKPLFVSSNIVLKKVASETAPKQLRTPRRQTHDLQDYCFGADERYRSVVLLSRDTAGYVGLTLKTYYLLYFLSTIKLFSKLLCYINSHFATLRAASGSAIGIRWLVRTATSRTSVYATY